MKLWKQVLACIVWIGMLLSSFPARAQQATGAGAEPNSTAQSGAGQERASLDGLPDSPGATRSGLQKTQGQQSNLDSQSTQSAPVEPQTAKPQAQTSLPSPQKPVGTAAAGPLKATGVAASQPAGVAVAPAKQRRTRTIVLRVGAIVGAGVAVGTVVALTQATPSKPPGAK